MKRNITIHLYQLQMNENNMNKLFRNFKHLEKENISPVITDYEKVYEYDTIVTKSDMNQILESVFKKFNTDHPDDYKGRSLSVSDVIAVEYAEFIVAYYIDTINFKRLDKFFGTPTGFDIKSIPMLPYYLMIFDSKSDIIFEEFDDASDTEFTSQICDVCMKKHKSYFKDKTEKKTFTNYNINDLLCGIESCNNHATHAISIPKESSYIMTYYDESQ